MIKNSEWVGYLYSFTPPIFVHFLQVGRFFSGGVVMAYVCPVCDQTFSIFKCCQLKDGVVCNSCFEKSGLKRAGFPPKLVEVWEVVTMCDMGEDEKLKHIEKKREQLRQENEAAKARMETLAASPPASAVPTCPKCGSTSITANQKGFGVGKAVIGAAVAGPLGLVAGNAGAKKVFITCLNCGYRWQAGKK
ncbi:MAG: hypothetical protein U0M20_04130 [Christensenellales bacterium]|nr:hypothetical protein [Christensenellales bacterium]